MDAASCINREGAQAKPGDASMCLYCGTLSIFTRTMKLRLMLQRELKEWSTHHPQLFERMELARAAVMKDRPTKGGTA